MHLTTLKNRKYKLSIKQIINNKMTYNNIQQKV